MNISLTTDSVLLQKTPAAVLFVFENEIPTSPAGLASLLSPVSAKEFNGGAKQQLLLHTAGKITPARILLAGLGKRADLTAETLRRATGQAVKHLQSIGVDRAAFAAPGDDVAPLVEAAILAAYKFTQYKPADEIPTAIQAITISVPRAALAEAKIAARRSQIIAEATNYAREIGNLPGNVVYPAVIADYAKKIAKQHKLKCTVLDKPALTRAGFGGLLAVGGGSDRDPRFIVLEHNGGRPGQRPIAIVGKAITFDSGGISIKPSDKMDEMKFDKCGGVTILGAMQAIAALKLPLNVLGIIASAENMPSSKSYRPGDIITSYKGTDKRAVTIEVLNTDAEGRVVLGDAVTYARQRDAAAIIDFATLTGACVVALGEYAAGIFTNDEALQDKIRAAGNRTHERVWPLPVWQEYKDKIKSDVADIKNTGGRYGGASTGAAFIGTYARNTPWAHIDIAGTAWCTDERPYFRKGATGFGVRLLLDLLQHWR